MKRIVYPGSFAPITNGHVDLVERAANLFDEVIVAVAESAKKEPLFDLDLRVRLANEILADYDNVKVIGFNCLLTEFVKQVDAQIILRGLRTIADFEYEFQMVSMNRILAPNIETVFLAPAEHLSFISSSLVREIAAFGGDIAGFVHPIIVKELAQYYKN